MGVVAAHHTIIRLAVINDNTRIGVRVNRDATKASPSPGSDVAMSQIPGETTHLPLDGRVLSRYSRAAGVGA
jgi:hypothetical protein